MLYAQIQGGGTVLAPVEITELDIKLDTLNNENSTLDASVDRLEDILTKLIGPSVTSDPSMTCGKADTSEPSTIERFSYMNSRYARLNSQLQDIVQRLRSVI